MYKIWTMANGRNFKQKEIDLKEHLDMTNYVAWNDVPKSG